MIVKPSRKRIALAVGCAFLMVGLFAQPAAASSRVVGWYGGEPSGLQYYVECGDVWSHTASNDLIFQVCNYGFGSGGYQAWGRVNNINFTKKVAASTAYVDGTGRVVRAYTATIDRTIGIETDSYFGAIAIDRCDLLPKMRLVYGGVANYRLGNKFCESA